MKQTKSTNSTRITNPETFWQAVLAKDATFDGQFVYAVRSTGIYCKPSCSAKRPHREQVAFFWQPEEAEQAGFRPCKLCRPQRGAGQDPMAQIVETVCQIIAGDDGSKPLPLAELSRRVNLSPEHLQKTFKKLMGVTPKQYQDACRMERFKVLVKDEGAISEALYEAGFGSSSRLYEQAATNLGMTPGAYRSGGKNMKISYTINDSPFGRLLVGATGQGICMVSLGDIDEVLIEALHLEFPEAELEADQAGLKERVGLILDYLSGRQPHFDLPVDIRTTSFRLRVYEALKAISYGKTCSYEEIAQAIGNPKAVRAVGSACANNPVALVIPCHRVVRKDGSLGGYRWGLRRKEKLLEMEREKKSDFIQKLT